MPVELWNALPPSLSKSLAAFQHAGAVVLTGFDRLADMSNSLPDLAEELSSEPGLGSDDQTATHDAVAAKLFDHQRRSSREETKEKEIFHCAPYRRDSASGFNNYAFNNPSSRSSSFTTGSVSSISSGSITRSNSTSHPSPNSLQALTPDTPLSLLALPLNSLGNGDITNPMAASPGIEGGIGGIASPRLTTSKFVHHHDLRTAQYVAELHHLRHEMLVRLRHAARRVDAEWKECRRASFSAMNEMTFENGGVLLPCDLDGEFETWWKDKKERVADLEHKAKAIGRGVKISIGWGGDAGLGWVA